MKQGGVGPTVSYTVEGEQQLRFAVGRMIRTLDDLTPLWDAFDVAFVATEIEQFRSEGGVGARGGGWKELSKPYAAWKAAHFPGAPILVRSGILRAALIGGPFHVYEPHPTFMLVGADVAYGTFHQTGDGVPQRRPIDVNFNQETNYFGRAVGYVGRDLGLMWAGR